MAVLEGDELGIYRLLHRRLTRLRGTHDKLEAYYQGNQTIASIGIAIPEVLRPFIFPLNWPRITVDSVVQRQSVRSFSAPGDEEATRRLRYLWEANNMQSQQILNHTEARVQGHSFVSIATNPDDPDTPIITAEPARSMICYIDPATKVIKAALRVYYDELLPRSISPEAATLYLPNSTIFLRKKQGKLEIENRDDHYLGVVPIVQFTNKPLVGSFIGESEMADVIRPTDMAARVILDLQIAVETAAVPGKYAIGVDGNNFIDPTTGKPTSAFQQYFTSMLTSKDKNVKFGQFSAANLENFTQVVATLSQQVSAITGLPARYFGQNTANPSSEGAIRADEVRLVKNVEMKNSLDGDSWSQVMAIAYQFATGRKLKANLVRCDWDDPNTPTYSQKADAIQKMRAAGLLSREGAWDELGWSEARKDAERAYLQKEQDELIGSYMKPSEADNDGKTTAEGAPQPSGEQGSTAAQYEQ